MFDWHQAVADELDCTAADPWSTVPSQDEADTRFEVGAGTLVLADPDADELSFELEELEVVYDSGAETPGGVLDGAGVFHACDVDRAVEPSSTTY